MENYDHVEKQENSENTLNKTEEILTNVASKLAAYEEAKKTNGNYSFGDDKFKFITNNPLVARFFMYPCLGITLFFGIGALLFSDEKIIGVITILIVGFIFINFRKQVKKAKVKSKNYKV